MNTYSDSVKFLFDLEIFGMKFGLRGIRSLLGSLGNPEKEFPALHVAGTNGKGSTASMLASVLTAAGYKTGLYTSPHLVSFTERIRIDGKPIPPREVIRLTNLVKRQVKRQKATFFEAVTAIAFKYFSDSKVDIAVVETGLGGRLDATNVLRPCISVITNVSLEHTEILGDSLEQIAREKGGIIKHAVPCVTGISLTKPFKVVRTVARKKKAPLSSTRGVRIKVKKSSLDGLVVDAAVGGENYPGLRVSLNGEHQAMNVAVVLQTLSVLRKQGEFKVEIRHIRQGLMHVQQLAGLQARLSVLRRKPLILVDVAHNPDSIKCLVDSLCRLGVRNVFLVFGVVREKDYEKMIWYLKPITRCAILTKARTVRSRSITDLALEFSRQNINVVETKRTVRKAVESALSAVTKRQPILITGSHFVAGEALSFLRSRKFT